MSLLLKHGTLATMVESAIPYGRIADGAVLLDGGRIAWVGPSGEAPGAAAVIDLEGRLVTPGLIDCHTHLVYAGSRSDEFEARLAGKSYAEIAQAGGGILSTVRATRAADEATLLAQSLPRLDALLAAGVTTVEIKSGYGLDEATELKMLRAARALGTLRPVSVVTSYLGAHAVPPEHRDDREGYLRLVGGMMAKVKGLADAVDAFCETIAFSLAETELVFARGAGPWPAGQAACRAAVQSGRDAAGGAVRRPVGRPSRISRRGRRRGHCQVGDGGDRSSPAPSII